MHPPLSQRYRSRWLYWDDMASKKEAIEPKTSNVTLADDHFKRLPWRSIGPAVMGGRISSMCYAPGNVKTFFLAYATGGLWRTTNLGTTFEPLFDKEETSCLGSVVCCDAPADWAGWTDETKVEDREKAGKAKIVWVGTGEGNGRNSSSWGNGVYRSTDSGKKWTHLGLADTHDIPAMAVHPTNPDIAYVAALGHLWGYNEERGIYKTTDGGKTWSKIFYIDEKTGCCDIIMDPTNPEVLYAAMYMRLRKGWSMQSGGPEGGIYKSTDGGKNWTKLSGGLPAQTGRIGLDIYAKDTNKLIAVVESTVDGANSIRDDRQRGGGVFRSDDAGKTWRRLSVRSPRAFYFSKIKFDPNNDQRVFMLGWTTEISEDGGETFRGGFADILHADHHAILVNPSDSDNIIIGTDGGVCQTFDGGKTWDYLNTMATGQFYNVGFDMSEPYRIIGGLQDNGTWVGPSATQRNEKKDDSRRTTDTGITNADWQDVFWGDGFHAAFDPTDENVIYAEWQGGHITRVNLKTAEKIYCAPEAREGEPRHRFNWNSPFFISPHDPTVLYHAGNYVFKLTKRGDVWKKISPDLTTADPAKMETEGSNAETFCTVVSLAESDQKKGLLWAGSDDGRIHVSENDGGKWKDVTPKEVGGRYVSRLEPSHHVKTRCYASIDGHRSDDMSPCVLVTEDLGATWTAITANLPAGRTVKVIREDKFNPDVLYVGTEQGIFVSVNRGGSWVKFHGKGFPTVPVDDIQQHPRERDLILGTHGRSIWILDGANWVSELTAEVMEKALHLFTLLPAKPQRYMEVPGSGTNKMFRGANPPAGLRIDYWVKEFTGDPVSISVEDAKGNVLKKLSGGMAPGHNRVTWDLVPEEWYQLGDKGEEPWIQQFFIRPGEYTVKLSMGDHKAEGKFSVV